ncbi:4-hydroxythreonine-4-phosphate dehydrogenase PdxA [Aureimonas sp. OT7]|uniref:PdxA family dehydrogenase n=1 Tax=Aureimonas TaxID=414371 RepID=UPI0017865E2B|nr:MULTISPECIES: 4-hydroxythreonine-4-phosphate dehydrogenase PdxA [Aureimonas]QOG06111.1 4-hydroxythreonine-4-phosphate dehydrogenase PdxA [Aureimonas sp. OT7]
MPHRPIIALTAGDCTGIGPELVATIVAERRVAEDARLLLIGDARVFEEGQRRAGKPFRMQPCLHPAQADWSGEAIPTIDLANTDPSHFPVGVADANSGKATGDTLKAAIDLAIAGSVDAVSFAPLNKRALYDGGWRFPDEHRMFAHLLGHRGHFSEMNVLGPWWMSRVTSHVSLRQALDQIDATSIRNAIRLAVDTMRRAGIEQPRLAVAALNPHAGENGLFGSEEIDTIAPAVAAMAAEGYACEGPFPADTVYLKAFGGVYDGVLAMYHDQGQIATKLKGFNQGVTVTAGLSTVFTTPAHGTAFDIAGTGSADAGAMEAALRLAARLAARQTAAEAAA